MRFVHSFYAMEKNIVILRELAEISFLVAGSFVTLAVQ